MDDILPILIIGAGPSGLTAANIFARFNIPFRIIDKKPGPTQTSNALALHARTLELLEVIGLADIAVERGKKVQHIKFNSSKAEIVDVDLSPMPSKYNFVCELAQSETEKLLLEPLSEFGVEVEYGTQFIQYAKQPDYYDVEVKKQDNVESIKAKYILASDGFHSKVRGQAQIPYEGRDLEQHFIMMDASMSWNGPDNALNIFTHPNGALMVIPFGERTRIIAEVDHDPKFNKNTEPDLDTFKKIVKTRCYYDIHFSHPAWFSKFWIHERLAESFRFENIFLSGDAAHVHSPAGGRGMNYSMQDAFNIAWKLAYVLKGFSNEKLLDSYNAERRPLAKQLIESTAKSTRFATLKNPLLCWSRDLLTKFAMSCKRMRMKMICDLSELTINYRSSPIVRDALNSKFKAGDRAPEVFHTLKYVLLLFPDAQDCDEIKKIITEHYSDWVDLIEINKTDEDRLALWQGQTGICFVRPDQYITFCGSTSENLQSYLTSSNAN